MRIIQFLESMRNDFVGPFSDEYSARRWLEENDRQESYVIHHLVDPSEEMYGDLLRPGVVTDSGGG
jgi:hypothetical protein